MRSNTLSDYQIEQGSSPAVDCWLDFNRPRQYIEANGAHLAHWKIGSGPDLVFVHGFPLHSATWRNVVPILAENFTCHLIDLTGTGKTHSGIGVDYSLEGKADTLYAAVKALGLKKYGLVSHNSGGVVARFLAAKDPDSVTGLVISGSETPGHFSLLIRLLIGYGKNPFIFKLIIQSMKIKAVRNSLLGFGACFYDRSHIDGSFSDFFVQPILSSEAVVTGHFNSLKTVKIKALNRLFDAHKKLKTPVQLIWGAEDPFFPVKNARKMMQELPKGSEFVEIEKARLFVHEEHPERFANIARNFLLNNLSGQRLHSGPAQEVGKLQSA